MRIDRVTITGADDSIDPTELFKISREFPFVEWGILFSKKRQGTPRYPSRVWLDKLFGTPRRVRANLSAHLCGQWVRDACAGNFSWWVEYAAESPFFERIQLNFHGEAHLMAATLLPSPWRFILQVDGANDPWVKAMCTVPGSRCEPLFDQSGGAGLSPAAWPECWPLVRCGYAGGIGPDNVVVELGRITNQCNPTDRIWIDMERKVRSADDAQFELGKVIDVLFEVRKFSMENDCR